MDGRFKIVPLIFMSVILGFCFASLANDEVVESVAGEPPPKLKHSIPYLFELADRHRVEGRLKKALKIFKKIEYKSDDVSTKAKALISQAECLEALEKSWLAFTAYQRAVDEFPKEIPFIEIIQREYAIADRYNQLEKEKFLFFTVSTAHKALEIYDHIILSVPYSEFTPEAIYKSGLLHFQLKQYHEASSKFRNLITQYPTSNFVDDARIYLARSILATTTLQNSDGRNTAQIKRILLPLISEPSDDGRIEEATEIFNEAKALEARKLLYLAEFYQREVHKRDIASIRYLEKIMAEYSDTEIAEDAGDMLAILKADTRTSTNVSDGSEPSSVTQ